MDGVRLDLASVLRKLQAMIDASDEERWAVWMVQARNFAKRENFTDAVARAELVCRQIERALEAEQDPVRKGRLKRQLARVENLANDLRAQLEAWRSAIADRRARTIANAAQEMARPLPLAPDKR